jgi:hypothetical protein
MWDNLPPGYDDTLYQMERDADAFEAVLEIAWERLEDAPDGVGWTCDEEAAYIDANDEWVFVFTEGGGMEFVAYVRAYDDPGDWYE